MVVIRLTRVGAKGRPFYHIVATDKRNARDSGRFIEKIGYFNPLAKKAEKQLTIAHDRFEYFLNEGAKCSERANALLKKHLKDNKLSLSIEKKIQPKTTKKVEKVKHAETKPAAEKVTVKKSSTSAKADKKTSATKVAKTSKPTSVKKPADKKASTSKVTPKKKAAKED